MSLGKTNCLCPEIARMLSIIPSACSDNGTACGFPFFIRCAGIFQTRLSVSISDHCVPAPSLGLTMVCKSQYIILRVTIFMFALEMLRSRTGSSEGGIDGSFDFTGLRNACRIPASGLASIKPVLTLQIIISLMR
mgnify:CR=1 FL=1